MRAPLLVSAAALCLAILPSCSSLKRHVTSGDFAAFKLRDLTRFGQPHLVKVSPQELEDLEQAELKAGHMASLDRKHRFQIPFRAPVDFIPPSLPDGRVTFDGSILPPKEGGSTALFDAPGFAPGGFGAAAYPTATPQNFSIE